MFTARFKSFCRHRTCTRAALGGPVVALSLFSAACFDMPGEPDPTGGVQTGTAGEPDDDGDGGGDDGNDDGSDDGNDDGNDGTDDGSDDGVDDGTTDDGADYDTADDVGTDTGRPACDEGTMDLTALGQASASSTFGGGRFPASLGVDDDETTSWFSAGPGEDGTSLFSWSLDSSRCLSSVVITGNAAHENPDFQEGFGFGSVRVRVLDAGAEVFEMTYSLDGSPDPVVTADLGNVEGDQVQLELSGHEDPTCGGFSELAVFGP